jgi:hypothetical protein
VAWQLFNTFRGRKSKLGQCCSKGCPTEPVKPATQRIYFVPSEMLGRRRHQ